MEFERPVRLQALKKLFPFFSPLFVEDSMRLLVILATAHGFTCSFNLACVSSREILVYTSTPWYASNPCLPVSCALLHPPSALKLKPQALYTRKEARDKMALDAEGNDDGSLLAAMTQRFEVRASSLPTTLSAETHPFIFRCFVLMVARSDSGSTLACLPSGLRSLFGLFRD